MEERTALKEKRSEWVWNIFFMIYGLTNMLFIAYVDDKIALEDIALVALMGIPLLFGVYRLLVFCFNLFLAKIIKKRFKINRLKGRVTPIYKIEEYTEYFIITKFSVQYTNLELCWSVPFSTLFEEQEYIKEGSYKFFLSDGFKTDEVNNTSVLYEKRHFEVTAKKSLKNSAKELKQQKINNLNKVFNENYK